MTPVPKDKAADQAAALREAAAANPELERLLAERDMLVQRMEEIADRSPGAFAGHDKARFPVEPLGERRARDARWAQTRDESRSAAIQRILESRRRDAAAEADHWPEMRERQRLQAAGDVKAEREAAEAEARALDARIEQARQDLLAERWAARRTEAGDEDWHALRERQAAQALAEACARTAEAAAREQALERRIERDRAGRPADGPDPDEQRRARALELARRQAVEAAAAEQALDRRLARAREDRLRENRAAQDVERAAQWVPPSERRDPGPLPPEPERRLPPTAAERSLDERIARARESDAPPRRPKAAPAERTPRRPEAVRPPPPQKEREKVRARPVREGDNPDALFPARHGDRFRAAPLPAVPAIRDRKAPDPVRRAARPEPAFRPRPGPAAHARPERDVESFERRRDRQREARAEAGAVRRPEASPPPVGRKLREFGVAGDRVRRPAAERAEPAPRSGREALRPNERGRDRVGLPPLGGLGGPGRLRRPGEPGSGRPADPPFPLRDKKRDFRSEKQKEKDTAKEDKDENREKGAKGAKEKERETPPKPKGPAERGQDLDKRREQALERLKARREGERRDERRRGLSLDRLASMRGRFGGLGR